MRRTFKAYWIVVLKGMAMGAADVVPGVSGGTIAFITGIYEKLLYSISSIDLGLLKKLKKEGFRAVWQQINGNFLVALFGGIFISVFSLAKLIRWLLENHPILVWSFFFGLVLASVRYIAKQKSKWNFSSVFMLIIGASIAYFITTLNPLVTKDASLLSLFLAGAIAICAMILPGISGAFILVLLGAYKPILTAINHRDFSIILTVAAGALAGILIFSKFLKWLFVRYKNQTLAILIGFVVGSLNKIWPWKQTLTWQTNSQGISVPLTQRSILPFAFEGDNHLVMAIFLAIVGFVFILMLEKWAVSKQ